ncbi:hypothetical protein ABLE68_20455 [Nocardioides sp. CN2-186]|uniref:hypothetical protein n=1 Tax=Nocardioides tweenelious TaxID=3156607 RepID=UPI0032B38FCD
MPRLFDHDHRVDDLTSAAIHLLDTEGITAFTLRRIATVARVSPSSVAAQLDNKERMTRLITHRISARLLDEIRYSIREHGPARLVPDDELLPLVRSWLAMCELARGDDALAPVVAHVQEEEHRWLIQSACRLAHDDRVGMDVLHSLVTGLWMARCARTDPMSYEDALNALLHACRALGVPVDEAAA